MRIVRARCWKENLELTKPYTIAYRTISSVENLFIYLETDRGLYGIGSGSPAAFVTGEHIEESLAVLQDVLESLVLEQDVRYFHAILQRTKNHLSRFPAARAAVGIAMHDLFAKFLGIPLTDYWGRVHKGLPTSITIGIKSVQETLEEAEANVQLGFRIIKLKTGRDVEQDIMLLAKLREKVGPAVKIRIDANQGYDIRSLQYFAKQTQQLDVEFFEQPFPPGQLDLMRELPAELRQKCAADEDLLSSVNAVQLAQKPYPYGIFNIKLMKCGGLYEARRIAGIAEDHHFDLMWGCNDESIVSISAALHLALASPATRYLDLDGSFDLARDVVSGGFILKDGYLYTNDKPGLGVELK
ncbi:MAG: dipeptide epimerase [Lewinellaceae bacterium]|nr:dipeptide epimerase [Lewinellaceae bacterium]